MMMMKNIKEKKEEQGKIKIIKNKKNNKKEKRIEGIKIEWAGRLKGVSKATTNKQGIGKVSSQTLGKNIEYAEKAIQTKWGKIGLKIWRG